jgi:hypothetical protein
VNLEDLVPSQHPHYQKKRQKTKKTHTTSPSLEGGRRNNFIQLDDTVAYTSAFAYIAF